MWESGGQKGGEQRIYEEIMSENFPNLIKDMNINIQAHQTPSNRNSKRPKSRHYNQTFKRQEENILKTVGEKQTITYKGPASRLFADFS